MVSERSEVVKEIAAWLRHVDRMQDVPGAKAGMPEHNPLWDAANMIEAKFGGRINA